MASDVEALLARVAGEHRLTLGEHRLTFWAVYPWAGGFEVAPRCTCGVLWSAGDKDDPVGQTARWEAHLALNLAAALREWLIGSANVITLADAMVGALHPFADDESHGELLDAYRGRCREGPDCACGRDRRRPVSDDVCPDCSDGYHVRCQRHGGACDCSCRDVDLMRDTE